MSYQTPGVYIEEVPTLPPSVAQGPTAIPVFIGYTERGSGLAEVRSFVEYRELFGGPHPTPFSVDVSGESPVVTADGDGPHPDYLLYYAMSHYFSNGGGRCHVASVGNYDAMIGKDALLAGLALAEQEDEPTIIVIPEAIRLGLADDYHEVCNAALGQCAKLGDRFAILDIKDGDIDGFRNASMSYLLHGAAYHPYLQTTINHAYSPDQVTIVGLDGATGLLRWEDAFGTNGLSIGFVGPAGETPTVSITRGDAANPVTISVDGRALSISNVRDKTGNDIVAVFDAMNDNGGFTMVAAGDGSEEPTSTSGNPQELTASSSSSVTLTSIAGSNTAIESQVKAALSAIRAVLPPSAAMAGIYARVDRDRGVWKAPANVAVSAVIGPTEKITNETQAGLNVHPDGGKSINAIREFTGRGTLVWGARTLAGNDNEWRYVPVRRLFTVIEEATRKASSFAIFEPNDATTWLKVKGMIESYLFGLWEQGALAGPTPESAYFVNVGLGRTMTSQDVLEGRMIVEIGIAAVRPAEFIIIRFSHLLQEA